MLDYAAFPEQRQTRIRQLLLAEGRVVCASLAEVLQVSEHTIRRDLQELAREGVCKRVYGGAVSTLTQTGEFETRRNVESQQKSQLAEACLPLIKPGSVIFIDAGTTNLALAQRLPADSGLTIVTNAPEIAVAAMGRRGCEVIILGGRIHPATAAVLGGEPQQQLSGFHFDLCFLGGCGLDSEEGLSVNDYEDAAFKRMVAQRSSEIVVALTASKIMTVSRYIVTSCQELTRLVIPASLSPEKRALLEAQGLALTLAGEPLSEAQE